MYRVPVPGSRRSCPLTFAGAVCDSVGACPLAMKTTDSGALVSAGSVACAVSGAADVGAAGAAAGTAGAAGCCGVLVSADCADVRLATARTADDSRALASGSRSCTLASAGSAVGSGVLASIDINSSAGARIRTGGFVISSRLL